MAYTKEILTLAVEIGDCMLRNGAEIYRVEDTVVHILSSYEVEEFDVYVLSNGIFASANENRGCLQYRAPRTAWCCQSGKDQRVKPARKRHM